MTGDVSAPDEPPATVTGEPFHLPAGGPASGEPFFRPVGDHRFAATAATAGPWHPGHQHGGPPAALLGRAVERAAAGRDGLVARLTVELLQPVPVPAELTVRVRLVRPGRRVQLFRAELCRADRLLVLAHGWWVHALGDDPTVSAADRPAPRHPSPTAADASAGDPPAEQRMPPLPEHGWRPQTGGYLGQVEWRFAVGSFERRGPATVWTRLLTAVVEGEPVSPLQRVLAVADSASGVSRELSFRRWTFINPELTVHLHRLPAGEWVCLDARTTLGSPGVATAQALLSDREGPVGRSAQTLLVSPRPDP